MAESKYFTFELGILREKQKDCCSGACYQTTRADNPRGFIPTHRNSKAFVNAALYHANRELYLKLIGFKHL